MLNVISAVDEIIAGRVLGGHAQPAHHRYIVTVFGLYGRPAGKIIPVAALVRLLSQLGYEPSSVRSSISRLKKKGVLVSAKTEHMIGYSLSTDLEPHMRSGDERIFAPRTVGVGDPWLLASFSVPESERRSRDKIRTGLARLGFGTVGPGLCIAPVRLRAEALEYVHKHDLADYVEFFVSELASPGDIRHKVARWWDLNGLEREYRAFIKAFERDSDRLSSYDGGKKSALQDAFSTYVPMVTQWRRLPFLDPGLPPEFLPPNWAGITARRIFGEIHRVMGPLAARYAEEIISA